MAIEEEKAPSCGMRIMFLEDSVPEEPVVQVVSDMDGKKEIFNVEINHINPENASRVEMFALCSYADKHGEGSEGTDGLFQTFKEYEEMARRGRLLGQADLPDGERSWKETVNWVKTSEGVCDILKNFRDPEIMALYSKGKDLLGLYEKYIKKEGNSGVAVQ